MWCDNCEEETIIVGDRRCSKCKEKYNNPALDYLKEQERLKKMNSKLQVEHDPYAKRR